MIQLLKNNLPGRKFVAAGRRKPGRDGRGAAALSWLLVTAAVAGLAGLAVVIVQNTVEETGQGIANPSPRMAAAMHTASVLELNAKLSAAEDFDTWSDWETHFRNRCALIAITFGDVPAAVSDNNFNRATGGTDFDSVAVAHAATADERSPTSVRAQVQCTVGYGVR